MIIQKPPNNFFVQAILILKSPGLENKKPRNKICPGALKNWRTLIVYFNHVDIIFNFVYLFGSV